MNRLLLTALFSITLASPSQAMTTSQLVNFANNYINSAPKEEPVVYRYFDTEACLQRAGFSLAKTMNLGHNKIGGITYRNAC